MIRPAHAVAGEPDPVCSGVVLRTIRLDQSLTDLHMLQDVLVREGGKVVSECLN